MHLYIIMVIANIGCFCALLWTRYNFAKWLVDYHPEKARNIKDRMIEERSLHDKILHRVFGLPFDKASYAPIEDEELENLRRSYLISAFMLETILALSILIVTIMLYLL